MPWAISCPLIEMSFTEHAWREETETLNGARIELDPANEALVRG